MNEHYECQPLVSLILLQRVDDGFNVGFCVVMFSTLQILRKGPRFLGIVSTLLSPVHVIIYGACFTAICWTFMSVQCHHSPNSDCIASLMRLLTNSCEKVIPSNFSVMHNMPSAVVCLDRVGNRC